MLMQNKSNWYFVVKNWETYTYKMYIPKCLSTIYGFYAAILIMVTTSIPLTETGVRHVMFYNRQSKVWCISRETIIKMEGV